MVMDLKHYDGSLRRIDRVPEELKSALCHCLRGRDASGWWRLRARRQKWIDQAQSLNIYMAGASGKKLDDTYKLAWVRGLKTTYYLRTMAATHAEKSTISAGSMNAVPSSPADIEWWWHVRARCRGCSTAGAGHARLRASTPATDIKFCGVDDPTCEACQ